MHVGQLYREKETKALFKVRGIELTCKPSIYPDGTTRVQLVIEGQPIADPGSRYWREPVYNFTVPEKGEAAFITELSALLKKHFQAPSSSDSTQG